MNNVLVLETSTDKASVALVMDGEIVTEKSFTSDRRHNALLFEPLNEIFEEFGRITLNAVFVGSGPGSYSGTRVGIAAAQGAAIVSACKAIAIPSILATEEALSGDLCLAVGDARRGSFWTARIDKHEIDQGPELTDRIGLESRLNLASGKGMKIFSFEAIRDMEIARSLPTASGIWKTWENASAQTRALWTSAVPQPIYLAPPHITLSKKKVFGSGVNS